MNKYQEILTEIDKDADDKKMLDVFDKLSKYTVPEPAAMNVNLLQTLKNVLQENVEPQPLLNPLDKSIVQRNIGRSGFETVFLLLKSQIHLISWHFFLITALLFFVGVFLTKEDPTLTFLIKGAPLLALLTIFYECRGAVYGVNEMEASCPYTPAQLAGARIIITLVYSIILCTAATGGIVLFLSANLAGEKLLLWKLILDWLAPLVFFLGISLGISLRIGIGYACGSAFFLWLLEVILEQNGLYQYFNALAIFKTMPLLFLGIGIVLIVFYIRHLRFADRGCFYAE